MLQENERQAILQEISQKQLEIEHMEALLADHTEPQTSKNLKRLYPFPPSSLILLSSAVYITVLVHFSSHGYKC